VSSGSKTSLILLDPSRVSLDTALEKGEAYSSTGELPTCGEGFKAVREKADELEKKYGIRLLVGNEVNAINDYSEAWFIMVSQGFSPTHGFSA